MTLASNTNPMLVNTKKRNMKASSDFTRAKTMIGQFNQAYQVPLGAAGVASFCGVLGC
jgi:hypothetical protein